MIFKTWQGDLADLGAGQGGGDQLRADFLVANLDHVFVAGIGGLHVRPHRQQLLGAAIELAIALMNQFVQVGALAGCGQHALGFLQLLAFARQLDLLARELVIAAYCV